MIVDDDLLAHGKALAAANPAEWPLLAIQVGEALERILEDPKILRQVASVAGLLAARHECGAIVGASRLGERIATATLVLHEPHNRGTGHQRALLVDGLRASGEQLRSTADRLRMDGVQVVAAAVLVDGSPELVSDFPVLSLWGS